MEATGIHISFFTCVSNWVRKLRQIFWPILNDFEIDFDTRLKTALFLLRNSSTRLTSIINKELKDRKLEKQKNYFAKNLMPSWGLEILFS